jgi:Na+/H+ antiporter NhaD/arsenite permease-like protein
MHALDWAIFLVVYAGLALGTLPFTRLDRATLALLGGVAVVATGRMTFGEALHTIDFATLALLFAMMVLSAQLRVGGFYAQVVRAIVSHALRPWTLLIGVVAASAVLAAIFANDIVCLAFAPVLCVGLQAARRKALPYLIALATSSNIGSAATLIGNPQNMLIGQTGRLAFGHYTLVVAPLVAACLVLNVAVVAWVYRASLFGPGAATEECGAGAGLSGLGLPALERWRVGKTLVITAGLVGVFLFAPVPREVAALAAAGLVMVSRKTDPRKLLALVDWNLVLLFIGLFVVIGNVQRAGLMDASMRALRDAGVQLHTPAALAGVTLVLSNLVSNVPAVLLLMPGLPAAGAGGGATGLWYLLAVVASLAGNLTLLGSIANLIVAEQSKPHGVEIGFAEYLKTGLPLTICNTVMAVLYFRLWVR